MANLGLDGLASGMGTEEIINQLVQLERKPIINMQQEKMGLEESKNAWRDVNSRLDKLEGKLTQLKLSSTFQSNSTTSSNEDVATATATSDAAAGNYNLNITKMAQSLRIASDKQLDSSSELGLSGDVSINGQTVTIEATDSLNDINNTINETADIGVTSSIIDNTLVLESSDTGFDNKISLQDSNNVLSSLGLVSGNKTNLAEAATFSASSEHSSGDYPVSSLNDGDTTSWGNGDGWNDDTSSDFSNDWVQMDFGSTKIVDQVKVHTLDTAEHPAYEYGVKDYEIQYWNSDSGSWQTVEEVNGNTEGSVENNFSAVETDKIRIKVNDSNDGKYSRLTEVEAYNTNDQYKNVLQNASDAELNINGVDVTSSSNNIEDAVKGVNFNINSTGSTEINVSQDTKKATSAVQEFVDQYNSVMDFVDTKLDYDPEEDKAGALQGDSTLMRLQMRLRSMVTDRVKEADSYNQLTSVGIEIDRDGVMSFDSGKMTEAIADSPEKVMNLFNAEQDEDGFDGVATRMDQYVDQLLQSNTGTIPRKIDFFNTRMDNIDEDIEDQERRLESTRERYREQFTAMEEAMSQMQQQQSWMQQQLASLSTGGNMISSMM